METILERLSDQELVQISKELDQTSVPENALSRAVASELMEIDIKDVKVIHLLGIALPVLKEMSLRFKLYSPHLNNIQQQLN